MNTAEKMVAALAEVGHKATHAGPGLALSGMEIPPHVALRAWQIAHNEPDVTLAEYVARLKAATRWPLEKSSYDLWLKRHGVTLDEAEA